MDANGKSSEIDEEILDHQLEINGNVTDAEVYMYRCLDKENESYKNGSHMITVFFTACADIKDILAITQSPKNIMTTTVKTTTTNKVVRKKTKVNSFVENLTELFINKFYEDPSHLHDALDRENIKNLVLEGLFRLSKEENNIISNSIDEELEFEDKTLLLKKTTTTTNKPTSSDFSSDNREIYKLKHTSSSKELEQKKINETEKNYSSTVSLKNTSTIKLEFGFESQHKLKGKRNCFTMIKCSYFSEFGIFYRGVSNLFSVGCTNFLFNNRVFCVEVFVIHFGNT